MNVELPETLVIIESIVYKSNGFAIGAVSDPKDCHFILYIFLIFWFELDGEHIWRVNLSTTINNFYQKASRCGLSVKYPNNSSGLFNVKFLLLKIQPLRR
jgi:hypothetical protein